MGAQSDYITGQVLAVEDGICSAGMQWKELSALGYGPMVLVQQVRVIRHVVWVGALCLLALALVCARLWEHREALGLGWVAGGLCGWLRWGQLRSNIARRDRRYERNKIFVHYLSLVEIAIGAVAYNHFLAIPLGLALLAGVLLTNLSNRWWTILCSSKPDLPPGGLRAS